MKVINNLFSLSPEGQIPGYGSMQEGLFLQDFLILLFAYLNQGEPTLSTNPDLTKEVSLSLKNNDSITDKLPSLSDTQQFFLKDIEDSISNHLTQLPLSDFVFNTSGDLKNSSQLIKKFTLNEEGKYFGDDFSNLSLYIAFTMILLERFFSYDSNKLNTNQESQGSLMNNFPEKGFLLSTLNFDSHQIQDQVKEVLTSIERNIRQIDTEKIENFFETFSSLNKLSGETQDFLKSYFETLRAEIKEGYNLHENLNLTKIKDSFSQLSDKAKEEIKGLIQQAKEEVKGLIQQARVEVKEVILQEKGIGSNPHEVSLQRFWLSGDGKPLLLKVKTFSVKEDFSSDSKQQVLIQNPVDFYLKGKEVNSQAEAFFQENRVLSPKVQAGEIHHFVKELTIEIVPSGERRAIVQLEPPELGKMELEVKVQNGEVEVHARVEKLETLSHLQQDFSQIKTQLEDLGLRLKDFQISLGLSPEGKNFGNGEEKGNQRKGNKFGEGVITQVEGGEDKSPLYHQGRLYRIV